MISNNCNNNGHVITGDCGYGNVGRTEVKLNQALDDFNSYLQNKDDFENNLLKLAHKFTSKGLSYIEFQNYLISYGILLHTIIISKDTRNKLEAIFKQLGHNADAEYKTDMDLKHD